MGSPRRTLLVEFSYPGWPFFGLQPQPDRPTAGGTLLELVQDVFGERGRGVCFAARTDRFVSADQNFATLWFRGVADFEAKASELVGRQRLGLRVLSVREVPRSVNARNTPTGKRYRYTIEDAQALKRVHLTPPLRDGSSWCIAPPLNEQLMAAAGQLLVGTHDFSAFRAKACSAKTTVRSLSAVKVVRNGSTVVIELVGDGFLRKMVRLVVGCLAEVGCGLRATDSVAQLLAARQRVALGFTAPGHGLRLAQVYLPEDTLTPPLA